MLKQIKKQTALLFVVTTMLLGLPLRAQTCDELPHDSLPLTEDFESWNASVYGPIGTCWSRFCSYGDFYDGPFVQTQYSYSPSTGGSVTNRVMLLRVSPGDQWTTSLVEYLVLPPMDDVRELTVDFKVKRPNAHPAIEVGVMEDNDTSSFVPIQLCAPSTFNQWTSYSVSLSSSTGMGNRIAFKAREVGSYLADIFLDDITVWIDSCAPPCCLTAGEYADSSVDLSWLAVDTTADFLLIVAGVDTVIVSGNHYTLYGLSPVTEYSVSLRTLCSSDTSDVYTTTFQTPVLSLPYHEHFDTLSSPMGWKKIGGGQVSLNTYLPYDGTAALYFMEGANDNLALLPVFPLEVCDLYIDFFARPEGIPLWGSAELDVGYVTDATNPGTFHTVATLHQNDFPASAYGERYVTFEGAPTGARMAFRHRGTTYYGNWLVDNVEVGDARCPAPWIRSVDSLGTTEAHLSWQSLGEWVDYLLAFGTDTTLTSDTMLTLNMLTPNTNYVARLARICDNGDTSAWVNLSFRTDCATLTYADMPYIEDFESYPAGQNSNISPCWRMLQPGGYGASNRPFVYPFDGSQTLMFGALFGTCDYVVLPAVDSVAGLTLSFQTNTSYLDKVYDVGIMTDHDDISTFTLLNTFSPVDAGVWESWELPLASYDSTGQYVAIRFRTTLGADDFMNAYLDNVTLSVTDVCPRPAAVTVDSVDSTTAWVTINDPTGVGNYVLTLTSAYGTDSVTISSNTHIFTGLLSSTPYTLFAYTFCSDSTLTDAVTTRFTTSCTPIASLPYRENFNNTRRGEMPPCWQYWPAMAYAPPAVADSTEESQASPDGTPSLYMETGFFRNADYAVLPPFDVPLDTLQISFWYRHEDTAKGTLSVGYISGYPTDIYSGLETFDFVALEDFIPVAGVGTNVTVRLDSIPASATHIVFRWFYDPGADYSSVSIDNIVVDLITTDDDTTHVEPPVSDTLWRIVTVTTNVSGAAEPYGSGIYADSSTVEIGYHLVDTTTVGGHWQFLGWNDGGTDNPRDILVTSDTAIVALFEWVSDSTEGINELSIFNSQFSIYPNPASKTVTVETDQPSTLTLTDATGRECGRWKVAGGKTTLDISTLPAGVYFVRLSNSPTIRKLIIK